MKPRKPDRFERMVRKEQLRDGWGIAVVLVEDVIKFLRNEHAWMERMVQNVRRWSGKEIITKDDIATVILARLTQRRK